MLVYKTSRAEMQYYWPNEAGKRDKQKQEKVEEVEEEQWETLYLTG
jgi:hypothetical protein